jgi:hypothetical protein
VAREFFDKPETEDRRLGSVVKNVQTDQARVQVVIGCVFRLAAFNVRHFVIEIRYIGKDAGCQDSRRM